MQKKLIRLRHERLVITDGRYELADAENENVYTFLRKGENESLLVVCNFTDRTIKYSVKEYLNGAEGKLVISNYEDAAETEGSGMRYADEVTLSNDEDGVAVVLERIVSFI